MAYSISSRRPGSRSLRRSGLLRLAFLRRIAFSLGCGLARQKRFRLGLSKLLFQAPWCLDCLARPSYSLAVDLEDGSQVQIAVGSEFKENFFYARKLGDDQVYTVARYRLDNILKRPEAVQAKEE